MKKRTPDDTPIDIAPPHSQIETTPNETELADEANTPAVNHADVQHDDGQRIDQVKKIIEKLPITENGNTALATTKESRIQQYNQKIVRPEKPPFLEVLAWAWRSRGALRYTSIKDAKMYDRVARSYFGREKLARQIGAEFLKYVEVNPSQATICDRAAGTGIITEALLDAGFKVRASDLSGAQLQELSERLRDVETTEEDINSPMDGVENDSVDGIVEVAADRFMTTEGQAIFVEEARRVLKNGGILIWPTFYGEVWVGKAKHGLRWRAGTRIKTKLLQENDFDIVSNDLKLNGLSFSSICRILVAKKRG